MKNLKEKIFLAIICLLLFCLEISSIWGKGLTYDEGTHIHYGLRMLRGDSSRFDDSKMPISVLNALPIFFADILKKHILGEKTPPVLFYHSVCRIPTMLFSVVFLLVIYFSAKFLYGEFSAKIAALLFCFCPNIIAHSSLMTNDVYAAGSIFFSVVAFLFYCRRRNIKWLIIFSFSFVFALISKFTCVFLLPLFALIFVLRFGRTIWEIMQGVSVLSFGKYIKAAAGHFAIFAIIVLFLLNAAYLFNGTFQPLKKYNFRSEDFKILSSFEPFSSIPLPVPAPYLEGLDWVQYNQKTGKTFGNIYMLGRVAPRGEGFKLYYLVVWLFKIPVGTQIIFYSALLYFIFIRKSFSKIISSRDFLFLLLPAFYFFFLLSFVLKAQLGVRYMLICMPFIFVFSAGQAVKFYLDRRKIIFIYLLLTWNFISLISYFPHFTSYFNEFSIDRKNNWRILADSNLHWGENVKYLYEYFEKNPQAVFNPEGKVNGLVVVDANCLAGVTAPPEKYAWLRDNFKPAGHIAYSYIIFDTRSENF